MTSHPNASAAGVSGALTVVLMFVLTAFGVSVSPELASAVTTLITAAVLFAGNRKKHA